MADHDRGYKLLFSHPRMVEDLLRGFVRGDWVSRLDFTSLEPVSGDYVGDDLSERRSDLVWRLRWADGRRRGWLYLLLEFQSTPQPFMALRLVVYAGMLLQNLIRTGRLRASRGLPAVLAIVLYNGRRRWRAVRKMADLFAPVARGLRRHLLGLEYVLVDGTGASGEEWKGISSPLSSASRRAGLRKSWRSGRGHRHPGTAGGGGSPAGLCPLDETSAAQDLSGASSFCGRGSGGERDAGRKPAGVASAGLAEEP